MIASERQESKVNVKGRGPGLSVQPHTRVGRGGVGNAHPLAELPHGGNGMDTGL